MEEEISIYEAAIEAARLKEAQREQASAEHSRMTEHAFVITDSKGAILARVPLKSCVRAQDQIRKKRIGERKADLAKQFLARKIDNQTYQNQLAELPAASAGEQVLQGLLFCVTVLGALGIGAVLFSALLNGCQYMAKKSKENEGKALACMEAGERLDQVKRLRDNGFVSESAVRAIDRQRDEVCGW